MYRQMKRSSTTKELIEAFTPTEEERRFVSTMTRTVQNQFNLMLWIKLFPCLGYFPALSEIPAPLVDHIRKALDLAVDVAPLYDHDRTLYRHHQLVREYYQIIPYAHGLRNEIYIPGEVAHEHPLLTLLLLQRGQIPMLPVASKRRNRNGW